MRVSSNDWSTEWKRELLGTVCDIEIGKTPPRNNQRYWNGSHTWLSIADMTSRVVSSSKEGVTDDAIADRQVRLVKQGTLLMSFKLTIGKLAFAGKDLYTNEAIAALTIKQEFEDKLLKDFLYWTLQAVPLEADATLAVKGKTLNKKTMQVIPIPIPSIPEQQRIVARIEALLAEVGELRKLQEEIEKDTHILFDAYSRQVFEEINVNHSKVKLVTRTSKIGSGSTPRGGKAVYKKSGVPLIRSLNVRWNSFSKEELAFINENTHERMASSTVLPGDVLLNITGASIGRACCAPQGICPANVNQHVSIIRPNDDLLPEYLMYWLTSPGTQIFINANQSGATRQALTKSQIENFEIPLPELKLQISVVKRLNQVRSEVEGITEINKADLELLKQFEQSILVQAFSGEL